MKRRSITFLLTGTLLATLLPSVVAASWRDGDRGWHRSVPELPAGHIASCFRGWSLWLNPTAQGGVRNPGIRHADRNGDGWGCYRIIYAGRTGQIRAYLWMDNINYWEPESVF